MRDNVLSLLPTVFIIPGIEGGDGLSGESRGAALAFLGEVGSLLVFDVTTSVMKLPPFFLGCVDHLKIFWTLDAGSTDPPMKTLCLIVKATLFVKGKEIPVTARCPAEPRPNPTEVASRLLALARGRVRQEIQSVETNSKSTVAVMRDFLGRTSRSLK